MPKKSAGKVWKNITLHEDVAQSLVAFQKRLTAHLGFEPTISQTIRWLITNSAMIKVTEPRDEGTTVENSRNA